MTRGSDPGSNYFGLVGDWDNDGVGDVAFGLEASGVSYGRLWIFGSDKSPGVYTGSGDNYAYVEGDDDAYQESYASSFSAIPATSTATATPTSSPVTPATTAASA